MGGYDYVYSMFSSSSSHLFILYNVKYVRVV